MGMRGRVESRCELRELLNRIEEMMSLEWLDKEYAQSIAKTNDF